MKKVSAVLIGLALLLGMTISAQALSLTLSSGGSTVVVNDNGAGDLLNGIANQIIYSGTINGINVYYASGSSTFNPTLGTFDIGSYVISGQGSISLVLSDTGLILNAPALTPNVMVTQNLSNSVFGTTVISADVKINGTSVPGIASSLTGTGAISTSGLATIGNTFSMDELINVTLGSASNSVSLDGLVQVAPVPEPGTMVLLGVGLLGLAIYGKRRMNREA